MTENRSVTILSNLNILPYHLYGHKLCYSQQVSKSVITIKGRIMLHLWLNIHLTFSQNSIYFYSLTVYAHVQIKQMTIVFTPLKYWVSYMGYFIVPPPYYILQPLLLKVSMQTEINDIVFSKYGSNFMIHFSPFHFSYPFYPISIEHSLVFTTSVVMVLTSF